MVTVAVPFYVQLITCTAMAFAVCKFLLAMMFLINDPRFWVYELRFRQNVLQRYQRGLGIPTDLTNNWYFTELCVALCLILAIQQGILVFALMDVLRWNDMLEKIYMFHDLNLDVPRPNISPKVLDAVLSPQTYMYYSGVILALGGVFLMALDNKVEEWRLDETSTLPLSLSSAAVLFLIKIMISLIYYLVTNCTAGEKLLLTTLSGK